ncbi:MAG: 2-dehydropantoate 2-reductase [Acidimicrobiia bacterium]|nr:2-dehydropantoate 2-reductase [Acidimicrobiia bacterium]
MGARNYTVIGVGGVGGYYGARLAASGLPVRWVARSDVEHLRRHGLQVVSPRGDLRLTDLEVYGSDDHVPPSEVVIVATKTGTNEALAERVVSLVADRGILVVLQNGLEVEAPFAAAAANRPSVRILGAMSFICAHKAADGEVHHLDYEAVTVGAYDPSGTPQGVTDEVASVVADLRGAGLPTEPLEDLWEGRWRKLCWNVPFNGLSVLLDATTAEMVGDPSCREVVVTLMEEVVAAAEAAGHPVAADTVATMLRNTERMTPYAPSMKLDFEARRPLELEAIYRTPIEVAAGVGADMVATRQLHQQLAFLDRRNRS